MDFKNLKLIPPEEIPIGKDIPLDDLMDIYRLAIYMEELCIKNRGVGLSATQVNVPYNFFIAIKDIGFEYLVNCSYDGIGEKINYLEGCLSLRNDDGTLKQYEVLRFSKIKLKGKKLVVSPTDPTLTLIDVDEDVSGFKCIICQHEIDHANGILISQIGKQISIHRS